MFDSVPQEKSLIEADQIQTEVADLPSTEDAALESEEKAVDNTLETQPGEYISNQKPRKRGIEYVHSDISYSGIK